MPEKHSGQCIKPPHGGCRPVWLGEVLSSLARSRGPGVRTYADKSNLSCVWADSRLCQFIFGQKIGRIGKAQTNEISGGEIPAGGIRYRPPRMAFVDWVGAQPLWPNAGCPSTRSPCRQWPLASSNRPTPDREAPEPLPPPIEGPKEG